MKHENAIRILLAEFHSDQMDDAVCEAFDDEMLKLFGSKLDADIERGLQNHVAIEDQLEIARKTLEEVLQGSSWASGRSPWDYLHLKRKL